MQSFKKSFISYLREVSIVVIGVLIAVYLGSLKEDYDNRRFVHKTMTALQAEAKASHKDLKEVLDKHLRILDSLRVQLTSNNEEESLMDFTARMGGVQVATNNNNVLRFFISNKAELVDYEMITKLSEIEFASNLMNRKMEKLLDFAYLHLQNSDLDTKLQFASFLSNVVDSEANLVDQYDELLQEYKVYFPDSL